MASDGSGSSKTGASRKLSVVGGLLGGGSRGRSPTSSGQVSPKSSEAGSSSPGHERPPALNLALSVTASLEGQPSGEGGGTDLSQPPWPTSLRSQQGRPSPSPAGSLPGSQPGSQYGGSVGGSVSLLAPAFAVLECSHVGPRYVSLPRPATRLLLPSPL